MFLLSRIKNRNIENIKPTEDRPLSNTQNKLLEVYNKRLPIYKKAADFEISNNDNLDYAIEQILNNLGENIK